MLRKPTELLVFSKARRIVFSPAYCVRRAHPNSLQLHIQRRLLCLMYIPLVILVRKVTSAVGGCHDRG